MSEAKEYECLTILEGHESEVKSVAWHPSKNLLASCARDKSIWIWEYDEDFEFDCCEVLEGHSQDVKVVRWIPGTDYLASGSYDDTVKIWFIANGEYFCKFTLEGHQSTVWSLAFSDNGLSFISGSEDKNAK